MIKQKTNQKSLTLSLIILTFLLLQTGVTFRLFHPIWPFITYPMFSTPRYKGERLNQYVVIGILEDLKEVRISQKALGVDIKWFNTKFLNAMLENNKPEAVIKKSVLLYKEKQKKQLIALRLENHVNILSEDGLIPENPQIIKTISIEKPKE